MHAPNKNNKSALNYSEFVLSAIQELKVNNVIIETDSIPHVANPLSVAIQISGKKRLNLDLRYVNQFLWKSKIKVDDWNVALEYFKQGDFMFSFDLKSGYHHIEIFPAHTTYLGFKWEIDGSTRYFTFQVLPFGLSSAPYIFTKCLRPLLTHWRSQGLFIVLYLDDGWCRADTESKCIEQASLVKADLLAAGLVPNKDKSVWIPAVKLDWLGLTWNAVEGSIQVTERRILDIQSCINDIQVSLPFISTRVLASLAGKIISLAPVVGPISQLRSRFLHMEIEKR